jgi:thiamine biosynthesis lipoprotein
MSPLPLLRRGITLLSVTGWSKKIESEVLIIHKHIHNLHILCWLFLIASNQQLLSQNKNTLLFESTATKYLMGTKFTITATASSVDSAKQAMYYALKEVERIENLMSSTKESSDIYKINKDAGIKPVKVSYETFSIIQRSINYSEKYNGIFDITIGPISDLWGFNSDNPVKQVPPENVIDSLVRYVDYKKIILNDADTTVFLPETPMRLDLGGIAKGYAVDRASDIMKKMGIENFFVNGGGDVYVSGYKDETNKWSMGIEHPRDPNRIIGKLWLKDMAIGTSGDYERYAIIDGVRYCHIFDTKTGYPARLSESASAIAPTVEEAVVLSKILFIYGYQKYNELKNTMNTTGVIVDTTGAIHYDEAMKDNYGFTVAK